MNFRPQNDSRAAAFIAGLSRYDRATRSKLALAMWRKLSITERAALTSYWEFWARSKQLPPVGNWKTWGFLTGRGFGKTISLSNFLNSEVEAGRARLVCLLAQDEASAVDIQVLGPSGLIATAKPTFRPQWEASALQLVWPNGARAYVRTPEVPGKIRGLEYHLTWASELQSWPVVQRQEALDNVFLSTRLGAARVVWDATPKRRHPLLKLMLEQHEMAPGTHSIVRGSIFENAANLGDGVVDELSRKFGNTLRGKEELEGLMLDDAELSIVKQDWIDRARRRAPEKFSRRVVSIDPAITNRKGSDETGIVEVGLGPDAQAYVLSNKSGKIDANSWAEIALHIYVGNCCDLLIAETNKGGSVIAQILRSLAQTRGLEVIVLGRGERPPSIRLPGKVIIKEVYARGAKEERAEPVGMAYERGRVSHAIGADLASLENTLCEWEPVPGADSPGDLDALVHAVVELLELDTNPTPAPAVAFAGIGEVAKKILAPTAPTNISAVFSSVKGRAPRI
jgi:phage terminase large subunit-like protein